MQMLKKNSESDFASARSMQNPGGNAGGIKYNNSEQNLMNLPSEYQTTNGAHAVGENFTLQLK